MTIFVRWDATGFDCLAKDPGRRLASLLPQPWPALPRALERGRTAQAKAGCPGASASGEHSHRIYSPEAVGYFHEKKIFSKYSRGKKKVKICGNICFWFHTVSQLAVKKGPLRCLANILLYH